MRTKNTTLPIDFYIYLHRKATTGEVFYVGKGSGRRAWKSTGRSLHWDNIVAKHGYTIEIVQDGMSEWWAHEMERDLIALHGRENLCNFTDGGEGISGVIFSEEGRKNRAEGTRKRSDSPEWKKMHTEQMKKMHASPEYRATHAEAMRKMHSSVEIKAKRIAAVRSARARPVQCIETGITFDAGIDAVKWLQSTGKVKCTSSSLTQACQGKLKTAYGFTWRYVDV